MSISSMFQQMNQAVQQNPINGPTGRMLIDQMSEAGGGLMASAFGGNPYQYQTQGAKAQQLQRDLGGVNVSTTEGMKQAADFYSQAGDIKSAMALQDRAAQKQAAQQAKLKEQQLRENLAGQYAKLGLEGQASAIASGSTDLKEAQEQLRELQVEDLLITRGQQGRRALAARSGINGDQFKDLGLHKMTDDQFKDWMSGRNAEVRGFQLPDGTPAMLAVSKDGRVRDPSDGVFKYPSDIGLKPAPQVSKVHNISSEWVKDLGMQGVEKFGELHTSAQGAVKTLNNINRNIPLVDRMPTGTFAQLELFLRKMGEVVGLDYEQAANAEVYMADAGQRVAEEIKNFGAGTGLSDADREYAAKISAGEITVTPDALKRLLRIRKESAEGTIQNFKDVKEQVFDAMPEEQKPFVEAFYSIPEPAATPVPVDARVNTYLEEARGGSQP